MASKTSKAHIEQMPADVMTAEAASALARASTWTLARWARAGRLKRYRRPGFKASASFYSRAEVERLLPVSA